MFTWILVKTDISASFCVYFSIHATWKSTHVLWDAVSVCVCVYALVPALRKPDRIEFSLASSNLSICLLFSYSHILTFLKVFFRHAADWIWIWLNLFPNRPSLTFSSRFYSMKMFHSNFCHSKTVFVHYRLVVVSEKNVTLHIRQLKPQLAHFGPRYLAGQKALGSWPWGGLISLWKWQ